MTTYFIFAILGLIQRGVKLGLGLALTLGLGVGLALALQQMKQLPALVQALSQGPVLKNALNMVKNNRRQTLEEILAQLLQPVLQLPPELTRILTYTLIELVQGKPLLQTLLQELARELAYSLPKSQPLVHVLEQEKPLPLTMDEIQHWAKLALDWRITMPLPTEKSNTLLQGLSVSQGLPLLEASKLQYTKLALELA